jgi:hypothetical protein
VQQQAWLQHAVTLFCMVQQARGVYLCVHQVFGCYRQLAAELNTSMVCGMLLQLCWTEVCISYYQAAEIFLSQRMFVVNVCYNQISR